MKKLLFLVLLSTGISGCESCSKDWKHLESSVSGLNRVITLYSAQGETIKVWKTQGMVEVDGNTISWIGEDDKEVKISGTFTVEEQ